MSDISIQITKTLSDSGKGGTVTLYLSCHKHIGIFEAQRFAMVFQDAIDLASRWQETGNHILDEIERTTTNSRPAKVNVV